MYKIFKDGNRWCATHDSFVNLQVSPAGFGDTPTEAMEALIKENEVTIPEARDAYQRCFAKDPEWRRTYIDNIACCLEGHISEHSVRQIVADHILTTIF